MNDREFCKLLMKISTESTERETLVNYIWKMEDLLDETDGDDYFGTEGWKHHIGLE